ncbi:DUF3093 domain-containing protein [Mycobacterium sp. MYCO198283]|uniref:DUF3093 domain-containing protein n=1 Tax=Mycobacterium sp. MYCO198283 TaxID=2883505 RepID=UPI001E284EF4|nr:DUF3093 domain-containing protein [Mycobacterium sp. MYCO198283]MCG5432329.1 DUF3093 domain-containing protein [Mycobacterium sp. MYCO198283]
MADESPLFFEPGASWWWLLAGPAAGLTMVGIQYNAGMGWQPVVPLIFFVLVSGFIALQIHAARIHTSVELTPDYLRQGAQRLPISEIVRMYPEAENTGRGGQETAKWQSSRALGELSGVPRGRTGIGLELTDDRTVQAWARNHRGLRAALVEVLARREA